MVDKALLLDLDGTLVDSERTMLPSFLESLKVHHDIEMNTDTFIKNFLGLSGKALLAALSDYTGQTVTDKVITERPRQPLDILATEGTAATPYGLDTLLTYHAAGWRLAVVSNSHLEQIEASLEHVHHPQQAAFRTAVGDEIFSGYNYPKPDPHAYERAMITMGLLPEDCVAVEDSPTGVRSAKAAGIARVVGYVGVAHDQQQLAADLQDLGVTAVMADWRDFPDIIERDV